jgi:cytoskeletal protein CcmA (bactofilin family)
LGNPDERVLKKYCPESWENVWLTSSILKGRQDPNPHQEEDLVIATGLTFEGKIEGSGHVRISGRFKGDVHVDGTLTVEAGAHLAGAVRAGAVVVAGEIEGNIEGAQRVELHQSGVVNGDISAGSLTVADGARMRGRAEFGWTETGGKGGGHR